MQGIVALAGAFAFIAGSWLLGVTSGDASSGADLSAPRSDPAFDMHYKQACASAECHPAPEHTRSLKHPPFLEEMCLECHNDHMFSNENLLRDGGNALCLSCHPAVELAAGEDHVAHPAETGDCLECHHPHESRIPHLLRSEEILGECADCHESFLEEAGSREYRHNYFNPRSQCGDCHYAHRNSEGKFLREDMDETCLTCHDLPIRSKTRDIENVAETIRTAPFVHEALTEAKSCNACHTPHGSNQSALLKEGYPAENYEMYERERYSLCWQCHSADLAENPNGTGVTLFRHGDVNLHATHVSEIGRGRACHLCHSAHASDGPGLIRSSFRYGEWDAPLIYRADENGGSCQTPCHREKEYRR